MPTILVCGDRNWTGSECMEKVLTKYWNKGYDTIIEGGAKGADLMAKEIGEKIGYKIIEVKAEWNTFGKSAGPIRNKKMLNMDPDLIIAFHEQIRFSKGTKNLLRLSYNDRVVQLLCTGFSVVEVSEEHIYWEDL
jgi:hypothetical protein